MWCRCRGTLETERLRACIAERLESLGLTGLALDRPRGRLCFEGGPGGGGARRHCRGGRCALGAVADDRTRVQPTVHAGGAREPVPLFRHRRRRRLPADAGLRPLCRQRRFDRAAAHRHCLSHAGAGRRAVARAGADRAAAPCGHLPRRAVAPSAVGVALAARPAAHDRQRAARLPAAFRRCRGRHQCLPAADTCSHGTRARCCTRPRISASA